MSEVSAEHVPVLGHVSRWIHDILHLLKTTRYKGKLQEHCKQHQLNFKLSTALLQILNPR